MPARTHDSSDDPLTRALNASIAQNESDSERDLRLRKESEARSVSETIDELIKQEKALLKKQRPVKILLLGQSESGKSTALKNFQIIHTPQAWAAERMSWRTVVQLNLIRSIRIILEKILDSSSLSSPSSSTSRRHSLPLSITPATLDPDSPPGEIRSHSPPPISVRQRYFELEERLRPLLAAERSLIQRLAPDRESGEPTKHPAPSPAPSSSSSPSPHPAQFRHSYNNGYPYSHSHTHTHAHPHYSHSHSHSHNSHNAPGRHHEISVNALSSWKYALSKFVSANGNGSTEGTTSYSSTITSKDTITELLCSMKEDIRSLWTDSEVRSVIQKRKLKIEDISGFFLDDLDRIASPDYTPSDDDILRARLKTIGVTEYKFTRETPNMFGSDWRIYDVGGSRTQRAAWAPYFQDVDAIIFLAPISGFDQVLVEDSSVNRLEDTVQLWKQVCSHPLLSRCHVILFMNKTDLMAKKLEAGVRLSRYIPSFGDRSNDFKTASSYLQRKFQVIFEKTSPERRPFYCHMTSLTDMHASTKVITSGNVHRYIPFPTYMTFITVADLIFQTYLRDRKVI